MSIIEPPCCPVCGSTSVCACDTSEHDFSEYHERAETIQSRRGLVQGRKRRAVRGFWRPFWQGLTSLGVAILFITCAVAVICGAVYEFAKGLDADHDRQAAQGQRAAREVGGR